MALTNLSITNQTPGGGNDTIYGGVGDDMIAGGNGSDAIYGGAGNDILWGIGGTASGTNNDVFFWQQGDAGTTGSSDQIRDFNPWSVSSGMKINITGLLENHVLGSTANLYDWVNSITTNVASSEVNAIFGDSLTQTSTKMVIDVDGVGAGTATQTIYFRNWTATTTDANQWVTNGWLVV